jgi:peptidyl-prolyl cis-trans isomerase C
MLAQGVGGPPKALMTAEVRHGSSEFRGKYRHDVPIGPGARMRFNKTSACVIGAVALLCACHRPALLGGKGPAPTGQVVAKVDGREVTVRDLQAELGGAQLTDPKQLKAAEQRAVELIVVRSLLADAARDRGLDKTPDFAVLKQRAVDTLLAQSLQGNIAQSVPAPAPEEVDRFISVNVSLFAERKIYDVDQIRFARTADPAVVKGLEPLNTLDDVAAYLTKLNIGFARGSAALDVAGMDPRVADAIGKLPAGALFVVPSGEVMLVNGIKASRVVPLTGNDAKTFATNLLKREHIQEAVERQTSAIVAQGMKRVQFNPAFAPPPRPGAGPVTGPSNDATNSAPSP